MLSELRAETLTSTRIIHGRNFKFFSFKLLFMSSHLWQFLLLQSFAQKFFVLFVMIIKHSFRAAKISQKLAFKTQLMHRSSKFVVVMTNVSLTRKAVVAFSIMKLADTCF